MVIAKNKKTNSNSQKEKFKMGLLDKIKKSAQSTSENLGDFFYTKEGDKKRIRMLCEIDDGFEVIFHSSYEKKINVPCQKQFGKDCPYCGYHEIADMKDKKQYVFTVYNQNEGKQQILMGTAWKAFSAIMPLIEEYEISEQTTFCDRDYLIMQTGKGMSKTIAVRGQKPAEFTQKITPWTKEEIMQKIDKAYPYKVQLDIEADEDDGDMPF